MVCLHAGLKNTVPTALARRGTVRLRTRRLAGGLHLHAGLELELCGLVQIRLDLAGGGAGGLVLQTGG
jgi:hypothetical protein